MGMNLDVRAKFLRKFGGAARRDDRRLRCLAYLTAIGVNLVFWGGLFSYRTPDTATRGSDSAIGLLRMDSAGFGSLKRWMYYHDPAKIGDSGYRGGFTAQLPAGGLKFDLPAERPRHTVELTAPEMRKFRPLPVPDKPQTAGIPVVEASGKPTPSALPVLPSATDDRGRSIRISPVAVPKRSGAAVNDDTVLLVTLTGGKINFIRWRSCGDPRLDGCAAEMVAAAAGELDPPPSYVVIRWPAERPGNEAQK